MAILQNHDRTRNNFKQAKILIVEDSPDHVLLIRKAITQCLPEVVQVSVNKADDALALLTDWSTQEWELPQLILQDLYIPNREDGWQLVNQIKTMATTCSRIPLVIFSSSNDATDIEKAYQYGISSYLVKPVDFADWLSYFNALRAYWWETVSLPPVQFSC